MNVFGAMKGSRAPSTSAGAACAWCAIPRMRLGRTHRVARERGFTRAECEEMMNSSEVWADSNLASRGRKGIRGRAVFRTRSRRALELRFLSTRGAYGLQTSPSAECVDSRSVAWRRKSRRGRWSHAVARAATAEVVSGCSRRVSSSLTSERSACRRPLGPGAPGRAHRGPLEQGVHAPRSRSRRRRGPGSARDRPNPRMRCSRAVRSRASAAPSLRRIRPGRTCGRAASGRRAHRSPGRRPATFCHETRGARENSDTGTGSLRRSSTRSSSN